MVLLTMLTVASKQRRLRQPTAGRTRTPHRAATLSVIMKHTQILPLYILILITSANIHPFEYWLFAKRTSYQ